MLECLKNLVDVGNNNTIEMNNSYLSLEKVGEMIEGQSYFYQEYKVNSNIEMSSYTLHSLKNLPQGSYVANVNNIYQGEFYSNENFRILIPKNKVNENISGQIEIVGKCKNYPIFYGEAPSGKQDYVLTYDSYGDVKNNFDINLNINTGIVKVIKKDKDTENFLEGVSFELVSEDGKYKYSGITDKNGEIYFENLFPGKYILKEVEGLDEYKIYEESFEIEIKYKSVKEIFIINELKMGNIKIIKLDKENNNIKLSGVIFELYDENMNLLEELITDENGEVESNFYPSENKKYYLKEVKTESEYILNEDLIEIKLEDGKTLEYEIKNEKIKIPEEPEVPVIPELPEEPEIPVTPEEPEIPVEPEIPIVPEEPEIQIEQDIPVKPEINMPDEPIIEEIPEEVIEIPKLPKTGF